MSFTCTRCGLTVPETGDRFEDGGQLITHMEDRHTPHAVPRVEMMPYGYGRIKLRHNPDMPTDEQLLEWFDFADGKIAGLRAVWRAGCDTGIVAP